jgi:D-alanyl-D-alanine carboxypeptidase/D-alanyl-D-alanine-endopeptidase (penicillin-binding protein 4)
MDPAFDTDDLNVFVENLRAMGIDTIRGRIVADCSMKDTQQWGEGWCWDDDNPILSPLLIARKSDFVERFVSVLFNSGAVLTDVSTYSGTLPSDAFIVCSRAHSITQILERMMKDSDNLYAESMFYQVAASAGHRPATAKDARTFTEQLIKRIGLNPKNYRIADGSGLSLYNYVSAELEVALLRYAWYNKHIGNSLLRSLPIAGEDGTLRKRMQQPFTGGNVIAKTGTVTGVSSLAGYLVAGNGHMICFSIINQGILRNSTGQRFQDRVCTALCQP